MNAQTRSLSAERLRALMSYDPETGHFTRRVSLRGVNAGERAGTLHKASGYVYVGIDGVSYRAHRLAWLYVTGQWPTEVDHINGDRADNRFNNLRVASRSQNNANGKRRSDNTSGHKGVNWVGRVSRWRAYVTVGTKQHHLGYFSDLNEAIAARREAAKNHYGEYARQ